MQLDVARSQRIIASMGDQLRTTAKQAALAIVRVANSNMERALRRVSIERGRDPREFTLVAFGGAGGLHACELADALEIPRVMIPVNPGNLCAWGCVLADTVKDYSQTVMVRGTGAETKVRRALERMRNRAQADMRREGFSSSSIDHRPYLDIRYAGQSFEISVPFRGTVAEAIACFHRQHNEDYGQSAPDEETEIVNVRLRAVGATPKPRLQPIARGRAAPSAAAILATKPRLCLAREWLRANNRVVGPMLIVEDYATTFLPRGWWGRVDAFGNLQIERAQSLQKPR